MPKKAKSKWHAVAVGRQIGAWYAPWEQIEPLVKGFRGKCHASFKTEQAALKFVQRYKLAPEVEPARNTISKERFLRQNPQLKESKKLLAQLAKCSINEQDDSKQSEPEPDKREPEWKWTVPEPTTVHLSVPQAQADDAFRQLVRKQLRESGLL